MQIPYIRIGFLPYLSLNTPNIGAKIT